MVRQQFLEVIIANHCGIKVVGFSGVPCMASAFSDDVLSHEEVLEAFESIAQKCTLIVNTLNKRNINYIKTSLVVIFNYNY